MNNGQLIDLDLKKLTTKEKNEYAEAFAEGSMELKKLLLKMWDNGIKTYACCVGHNKQTRPYISFDARTIVGSNPKNFILKIMKHYKNGELDFSFYADYRVALTYLNGDKSTEEVFLFFDKLIFESESVDNVKLSKKELEVFDAVLELREVDISKYLKNSKKSPACQINSILIYSGKMKFYLFVVNNMKCKSIKFEDKNGIVIRYLLAEGYYRKINGVYYTVKDGRFVQLKPEDLKNYRVFRLYKKYKFLGIFNRKEFDRFMKEVKS